ncbi:hypothetical protein BG004_005857, partial [Podila humilis]
MSQSTSASEANNLRQRAAGVRSEQHVSSEPLKTTRSPSDLMADHPEITNSTETTTTTRTTASTISHILLKPFYFILFVLLHLGHELAVSFRTMKTLLAVFFLPHLFPVAPEIVRVLRMDLEEEGGANPKPLAKKPRHLAVILPVAKEEGEKGDEEWEAKVALFCQWSVGSGIKTVSIMRQDAIDPEALESLQEYLTHSLKNFYKEEKSVPVALTRQEFAVTETGVSSWHPSSSQSTIPLHGGRRYDLDVVILSPQDGHDRLAGYAKALGEAALRKEIESKDITMEFMDKTLS